jgi:hypothetical protein
MLLGLSRHVIARKRGARGWSWAILLALWCCNSDSGSSGCGGGSAAERCEINGAGTACGDLITLECFEGATPDAVDQCAKAIEQNGKAIFCCTSAAAAFGAEGGADGLGGLGGVDEPGGGGAGGM